MAKQEGPRGFEMKNGPAEPAQPAPGSFTFASLVLSLSTSALMHLGMAPRLEGEGGEAVEGAGEVDLPLARQSIDILEMLEEKTRGNLDDEERLLLERVLHDLRLRFVQKSSKS